MNIQEKYINRCIQLARNGLGTTYPNPLVGSIVIHENQIIGEGWHQKAGEAHAEVKAIQSVKNKELLKNSTIYVSLEPCSHYGKTPPCSDLIIATGIKKVVIGSVDPFAEVAGRGIKKLLDAGCQVTVGVLEKECSELNKRFFTFHTKKRPYIILKWAESLDGFVAPFQKPEPSKRSPVWITNSYSRQLVHKWRAEEQAILIGTKTAVADNPRLNTRLWSGPDPVRVVLDQHLRIPEDSLIFDEKIKTILICGNKNVPKGSDMIIYEQAEFAEDLPKQICAILYRHQLHSVIIEGGTKTLETFIRAGIWDEARVFTGKVKFGKGIKAPEAPENKLTHRETLAGDQLKIYVND